MAFCIYCGKKLEDGEVCTCRAQVQPQQPAEEQSATQYASQPQQQVFNQPPVQSQYTAQPQQQAFNQPPTQPAQPQPTQPAQPTQTQQFIQMGKQMVKEQVGTKKFMFFDFIKLYLKRPNDAARLGAHNKDSISMLICAVVFMIANGLAQVAVGMQINYYKTQFFIFGVIFGLFGMFVPAILDISASLCSGNKNIKKRESFGKCILHTPMTSLFLILAFIVGGLFSWKVAIFLYPLTLLTTTLVYALSMISVFREALNDTMLGKLIAYFTIFIYIILFAILVLIEATAIGRAVYNSISDLLGGVFNSFYGSIF
jgi:hypothetical protein